MMALENENDTTTSGAPAEPKSSLEALNSALDNMNPDGGDADDSILPAAGDAASEAANQEGTAAAPTAESVQEVADDEAKKKADEEAAAAAADTGAKPTAEQPPKAEADDYQMPEGLTKKSQERFQRLVDANKDKDTQLNQLTGRVKEVEEANDWIRQNVMTDEHAANDLVMFADYRNALKKGDFDAAEQVLRAQLQGFQALSGRSLVVDPLDGFDDLRKQVTDLEITQAAAIELANSRRIRQAQAETVKAHTTEQEQQRARHDQIGKVVSGVDAMCAQWKQTDPDYSAKEQIILGKLEEIMASVPLDQVQTHVKILYESLGVAVPAAKPNPTPLRASGSGGGKPAPTSSLEAMEQSLGYR